MKPKVTIGICAKNSEKTILQALNSVIQQDFDHKLMELVFVDDGSTDDTLKIVKDTIVEIDFPVTIISGPWQGIGKSRNTIVQNANGEYIIWVDSDEALDKDFVRKQVSLMELNPKAAIGTAQIRFFSDKNLVLTLDTIPSIVENKLRDWKSASKLPGAGSTTYRVKAIKQVGGFDEKLHGSCEDIEAAFRMTKAGWLIVRGTPFFSESHEGLETFGNLWKRNINRGKTSSIVCHKNTIFFSLYRMNTLASFVAGIRFAILGYLITKRRVAFLLPFFYAYKNTAWFVGFTRALKQQS